MTETPDQRSIDRVVELLSPRPACVAFTGAGLSTRSGLPDFRSPDTGLWVRLEQLPDDAANVMTLQGFKETPAAFYNRFRNPLQKILSAEPNPAHLALAQLEAGGYVQAVVTQNGDLLHQKAGSQHVIELHGSIAQATCVSCYRTEAGTPHWQRLLADGLVPRCRTCGGVMKPDVILTGEQLPAQPALSAQKLFRACEVILAAGTSFSGGPIMGWIEQACVHGTNLIIINSSPTILDSVATITIRADVVDVLPAIADELCSL
jgi:NAD-dependent deacetylase